MDDYYGQPPQVVGVFDLDFVEYMHYMYLPVYINESQRSMDGSFHLPERLEFARDMVTTTLNIERSRGTEWKYTYVTARRGYATPGNPLNRPGWHADGFGTDDINYVWTDRYPTLYAIGQFGDISDDHIKSAEQFASAIDAPHYRQGITIHTYQDKTLLRLDDRVIHAAPEIPAPGGERSFFKVSLSNDRYNLKGNSHNYGLRYDWPMYSRDEVRNDPARAGKDAA